MLNFLKTNLSVLFWVFVLLSSSINSQLLLDAHYAGLCLSGIVLIPVFAFYNAKHILTASSIRLVPVLIVSLLCFYYIFYYLVNQKNSLFILNPLFCLFGLLFLLLTNKSQSEYKKIGYAIVIYCFIQSIIVFLQLFNVVSNSESRFVCGGTLGNPNALSISLLIGIWLIIHAITTKEYSNKLIGYTLLLFLMTVIVILKCRTVWVAIIGGALLYSYGTIKCVFDRQKLMIKLVVVTCSMAFILLCGYGLYSLKKESTFGRILVWKITSNVIEKTPFKGTGVGSFFKEYQLEQACYFSQSIDNSKEVKIASLIKMAYNGHLQLLVESGLVGLLCLYVILFLLFKKIKIKKDHNQKRFLFAIFGSLLIASMFNYTILISVVFVQVVVVVGFVLSDGTRIKLNNVLARAILVLVTIIGLATVVIAVDTTKKQIKSVQYIDLLKGSGCKRNVAIDKDVLLGHPKVQTYHARQLIANREWERAYEFLTINIEDCHYYRSYYLLSQVCEKNGDIVKAEQCLLIAHYMLPGSLMLRNKLILFYLRTNQKSKAIKLSRKTIQLDLKTKNAAESKIISNIKTIGSYEI